MLRASAPKRIASVVAYSCEGEKKQVRGKQKGNPLLDETRYGQCQKNGNMEWVRIMVSLVSVAAEALLPITTLVGPRGGSQTYRCLFLVFSNARVLASSGQRKSGRSD